MACHGCALPFGRKKEVRMSIRTSLLSFSQTGCPVCGYAFCQKCLSHKAIVPAKDAKKPMPVCNGCFYRLTNKTPEGVKGTVPVVNVKMPTFTQEECKGFMRGVQLGFQ